MLRGPGLRNGDGEEGMSNKKGDNDSAAWLVAAVWIVFVAVLVISIMKNGG